MYDWVEILAFESQDRVGAMFTLGVDDRVGSAVRVEEVDEIWRNVLNFSSFMSSIVR